MKRKREIYLKWLKLSEDDLLIAEYAIQKRLFNIAAFHSHQAAEKALKGLIILLGDTPEKTHVLTELIEQLESLGENIPLDVYRKCIELEPHYYTSRYPDLGPDPKKYYNEWLAEKLIENAKEVVEYVKKMGERKDKER